MNYCRSRSLRGSINISDPIFSISGTAWCSLVHTEGVPQASDLDDRPEQPYGNVSECSLEDLLLASHLLPLLPLNPCAVFPSLVLCPLRALREPFELRPSWSPQFEDSVHNSSGFFCGLLGGLAFHINYIIYLYYLLFTLKLWEVLSKSSFPFNPRKEQGVGPRPGPSAQQLPSPASPHGGGLLTRLRFASLQYIEN